MGADIFCRVVDNFGDIGVCWRLARRLAQGYGWRVRLWVDDLASFGRLAPEVAAGARMLDGVEIVMWTAPAPARLPLDVVIEAFACDPPPAYRAALTPGHRWLNLEYLTAEDWAEGCHGMPSPQGNGVVKTFFFPGFTSRTGGLLREPGLLAERDALQADPSAREAFLARIGIDPATSASIARGDTDLYPVFCYPDAPVAHWRQVIAAGPRPAVIALLGGSAPGVQPGTGHVTTLRLPFLPHADFDRLLWCGTVNGVRGEDSFVRAQWAARPLLWHIYPQEDAAHLDKLNAWLDRLAPPEPVRALHAAWNQSDATALAAAWQAATGAAWAPWVATMQHWSGHLSTDIPELAAAIVDSHKAG
ncbi:elongation factor P maturation arginine rhamnosyltransferase EarP [Achromobacter sp. GG226]|uniref:elongation factor P maturation arginine rhamnosyltransferase EarP n=1 Tax=Verticiella alkaliphila TaxID=2779529 RepID=UPI001C0D0A8C|nr:elongation factor P maturation arginine rhamnosyltransferase EarP [Verticiella sp. GG226]MBU4610246.1 elongation factor P maturation arginine rhamnosyltransferase EarP [Verticiella sp. GG226]